MRKLQSGWGLQRSPIPPCWGGRVPCRFNFPPLAPKSWIRPCSFKMSPLSIASACVPKREKYNPRFVGYATLSNHAAIFCAVCRTCWCIRANRAEYTHARTFCFVLKNKKTYIPTLANNYERGFSSQVADL